MTRVRAEKFEKKVIKTFTYVGLMAAISGCMRGGGQEDKVKAHEAALTTPAPHAVPGKAPATEAPRVFSPTSTATAEPTSTATIAPTETATPEQTPEAILPEQIDPESKFIEFVDPKYGTFDNLQEAYDYLDELSKQTAELTRLFNLVMGDIIPEGADVFIQFVRISPEDNKSIEGVGIKFGYIDQEKKDTARLSPIITSKERRQFFQLNNEEAYRVFDEMVAAAGEDGVALMRLIAKFEADGRGVFIEYGYIMNWDPQTWLKTVPGGLWPGSLSIVSGQQVPNEPGASVLY